MLALASTGFAGDMFNHRVMIVRDIGHFALLRIDSPAIWSHIHSVATTDPEAATTGDATVEHDPAGEKEDEDDDRPQFSPESRAMWRISAVRLLGMKDHGVFRKSIEKTLSHSDGPSAAPWRCILHLLALASHSSAHGLHSTHATWAVPEMRV